VGLKPKIIKPSDFINPLFLEKSTDEEIKIVEGER